MAKKSRRSKGKRAKVQRGVSPAKTGVRTSAAAKGVKLFFPPAGAIEGFTNVASSQFSKDPSSCVRELIQNSLDAAVDAGERTAKVHFKIQDIAVSDIPGIKEHRQALVSAKQHLDNEQSENVCEKMAEYSADSKIASVMFVSDNGIGLGRKSMGALLSDGISAKRDKHGAAGSYGNGHFSTFALSNLQYIFYGGVSAQDGVVFAGHAVLASHKGDYKGENKALGKDGYYVKDINEEELQENRFEFGGKEDIPSFLRKPMDDVCEKHEHGTVVAVVAFNHFGKKKRETNTEIILREAAFNFFCAIEDGQLEVSAEEDGEISRLDRDRLKAILDKEKDRRSRSGRRDFPSGRSAYNAYQTLTLRNKETVSTSQGEVDVFLREDTEDKRVCLCRNGMWISDNVPRLRRSNFGDQVNFNALIQVDSRSGINGGDAYALLKKAETPLHNQILPREVNNPDERKNLLKLLDEIQDAIQKHVTKKDGESYSPSDFFPVEISSAIKGKKNGRGEIRKIGGGRGSGGENKKRGIKRKSRSRSQPRNFLDAKISSKRAGEKLFICLKAEEDAPAAEIRLFLDEGADVTCNGDIRPRVYLKAAVVKSPNAVASRLLQDDGKNYALRLEEWKEGTVYHLEIEHERPLGVAGDYALIVNLGKRAGENSQAQETESENERN